MCTLNTCNVHLWVSTYCTAVAVTSSAYVILYSFVLSSITPHFFHPLLSCSPCFSLCAPLLLHPPHPPSPSLPHLPLPVSSLFVPSLMFPSSSLSLSLIVKHLWLEYWGANHYSTSTAQCSGRMSILPSPSVFLSLFLPSFACFPSNS